MELKKQLKTWKTIAIIFIILFALIMFFAIYSIQLGNEAIKHEYICAYDVCEDYPSYYYDMYDDLCQCYSGEESTKTVLIDNYINN